jgi:mono/diheme cytochrome c family protein
MNGKETVGPAPMATSCRGAFLLCATEPASAEESPAERRGLIFVREYCSQCHAIGKVGGSRLANAAPFRALRLRYPVADLQRPLLEEFIRRCRGFSLRLVK